jgi:HK97 gp10 family phage protein
MAAEVKIEGFEELARKLRELVPAMRKKVLRNALAAGARIIRDDAKRLAPVLGNAQNVPYRKPGTVLNAIRVRTSKVARKNGDVGVFVNVQPAKGAKYKTTTIKFIGLKIKNRKQTRVSQRGAKSPNDPYYWRFLEFGTKKMSARSFLQPAAKRLDDALRVFQGQMAKWFSKVNTDGKVTP